MYEVTRSKPSEAVFREFICEFYDYSEALRFMENMRSRASCDETYEVWYRD